MEFGKQALGLHPCLKGLGPVYVLFRQYAVSLGRTAWGKRSDMDEALWKQEGED